MYDQPPPQIVDRLVHLKLPVGHGCGFRLRDDVILTCHHVLPGPAAVRAAVARIGSGWTRLEPHGSCADLDYVTVVARGPGVSAVDWAEPGDGEELVVVEPRPSGAVRLTPVRATRIVGPYVEYDGPTRHGSSGSPVLNLNWQFVALHQRRMVRPDDTGRPSFTSRGVTLGACERAMCNAADLWQGDRQSADQGGDRG